MSIFHENPQFILVRFLEHTSTKQYGYKVFGVRTQWDLCLLIRSFSKDASVSVHVR